MEWRPQPKQVEFMSRPEDEVFYGGAAGGGKSDALVCEALRQIHHPRYKAILFRKTYKQLDDLIWKSRLYYPLASPKAKYNQSEHVWTFPSGAKIYFGSMPHRDSRFDYQGRSYAFIGFDELTHFTQEEYTYLFSRNRADGAGLRSYIRATGNPGGIGHSWVKERFITPAAPMTPISESHKIIYPDGHEETVVLKRIFVPSSVFDNKALMQNDPMYVQRLASMPEAEKNALLYGDWNSFSGMVFSEWRDDCEHYADRRGTHVINPFIIPKEWTVWRAMDWGFSRPFSVGWYAVDYDKRLYRIAEYYGCTGEPNVGVKENPDVVARKIREIENTNINLKGRKIYGVADPAIFNDSGTESISTLMEREGVWFERGDNERLAGKMQIHYRLRFDDGVPLLYVFNTCKNFIRTIPALVYSERHVEDVNTDGEDHIYDELRYMCMMNPITPKPSAKEKIPDFDPLNMYQDKVSYDRYDFFRKM